MASPSGIRLSGEGPRVRKSSTGTETVLPAAPGSEHGRGLIFAVLAYGIWGLLPLSFLLLSPTGPFEIVACSSRS